MGYRTWITLLRAEYLFFPMPVVPKDAQGVWQGTSKVFPLWCVSDSGRSENIRAIAND